jgi:hypothetical protein
MKNIASLAVLLLLFGCASPRPVIQTRQVDVPVAVSCKPAIGPAPAYPDTPAAIAAAPNIFVRTQLLLAGRLARIAREGALLAALEACG